jgi:hypothetical protein
MSPWATIAPRLSIRSAERFATPESQRQRGLVLLSVREGNSIREGNMPQKLSGGCACGAVRYQGEADPVAMFNCHCRDCQRASGSAYAAVVLVPKAAIQINGEPRYHRIIADSGSGIERGFCPNCGSQVLLLAEHNPDVLILQAGCLDDPSVHRPARDIFTASAQPWDHMDPSIPKFATTSSASPT